MLEKALGSADASAVIKEDLEVEAYTALYGESDPNEFRLLKILAQKNATSVKHEYDLVTSYNSNSSEGFFGEKATKFPQANIKAQRAIVNIRLMGEVSSVYMMANWQTPVRAFNKNQLVDINEATTRLSLLRKINQALYRADTRTCRGADAQNVKKGDGSAKYSWAGGASDGPDIRFKGISQQIEEGTTSSPVKHIIDMRGKRLLPGGSNGIREKAREIAEVYGRMTALMMPPKVLEGLEANLDPVERLMIPRQSGERVILGQSVGGMNAGGGTIMFELDNDLTPAHYRGKPPTDPDTDLATPVVSGGNPVDVIVGAGEVSQWTADDNKNIFYLISFVRDGIEGPTKRTPVAGTVAITSGQKARITINVTDNGTLGSYDSVRVYRGDDTVGSIAQFVMEVPGPKKTGLVNGVDDIVISDLNDRLPGTSEVYGLTVASQNYSALKSVGAAYQQAMPLLSFENQSEPGNTISLVHLGPFMAIFPLAAIQFTASNDLIYAALTPEVAVPTKQISWINVGDK